MTAGRRVRIVVRGRLGGRFESIFEGLQLVRRPGETELVGEIVDQAQLHGLLARIRDLGLELQCVSFLPDSETPSARPRPRKEGG
jgi:hypothetical protein